MYIRFLIPHRVPSELLEHTPTILSIMWNQDGLELIRGHKRSKRGRYTQNEY